MHARRHTLQLLLTIAALPVLVLVPLAFATMAAPSAMFEGRYVLRHSDDFARGRAVFQPGLELANGDVKELVFSPGQKPAVNPGSSVRLRGELRGNRIAVADGSTQVTGSGSTTAAATATKRVAVVLFTFSNATTQPYTPAYAAGVAFTNSDSVAAYYGQSSWGQLALTGDVYGWYEIASTNTSCSYSTWASQANQAATAEGVNLASYDYVAYGFPESSCGWSGLAYMPGKYSWLNGWGGMSLHVMAHELGHNVGSHHASSMSCTVSGVQVSLAASASGCTSSEYGDPFTVMGISSRRQHSNFSRGNFGWLEAGNTQTVTSSGDYLLRPVEYATTGVQALRIRRTSSTYLTLEFRQPSPPFDDFPATYAIASGVIVRITSEYTTIRQSQLVDTTPETSGADKFGDAPLAVGETLNDPLTGVSITTLAVAPTGATVRVTFGGAPPPTSDTTAPSQPGNLQAAALDANRVSLSWAASTDNVGVTGYRILRNSALVTTVTGTGWTDTGLLPATTYGYQVVAVDAAGNASTPASASATTPSVEPPPPPPQGDTTPPTAPTSVVATAGKGKKVVLTWLASTDDTGVAGYRVIRDEKQVGDTQTTTYTDTLGGKNPTAVYYVVAYDVAGNVSARSLALVVSS